MVALRPSEAATVAGWPSLAITVTQSTAGAAGSTRGRELDGAIRSAAQTNALSPVMARPTMRVFISRVPS